jgi:hypothetical protein
MNAQPIPSPFVKNSEIDLLRKHFKDNDALLLAMRAVMLGIDPTDEDKKLVSETFANEELFAAIKYRFLPRLSREVPIGQVQDIWLGIDQQILGQSPEVIAQMINHNALSIEMMVTSVRRLQNPKLAPVDTRPSFDVDDDKYAITLLGRNRFIRAVETQLLTLKTLANQPQQAPEDAKKSSAR